MDRKHASTPTSLGDLIHLLYEQYLAVYGDSELAAVAAAATINDLIAAAVAEADAEEAAA